MNKLSLIVLLSLFSMEFSQAQVLKGKITNQSGEPIQYSTVYIKEIRQGTTANTKGDYELRLKPGTYNVTYQSLGFEPVSVVINMGNGPVTRNVSLPVQYYTFPEVRITATGEDPAYIIMRKVIGMAPYYLNNISYYKAEVYLKGNLTLNRIPKIIAPETFRTSNPPVNSKP
ncbi:MAG: carboxypeptidase-like regulatory domain-containing protein, partial [Bacteroidales bacterium]|nr:carboxypeptidase-like regulatory domain-containing protein [Bacteroidales bacterium]